LKDILDVFEFKKEEFREEQIEVILSMLSKEEKKVFNLLKFSSDALTATQIYDYYIDKIINDDPILKSKIEEIKLLLPVKNKKPLEVKAEFARHNNVKIPTNRTVTRVLENLKDAGFIVKRKTSSKKAKAYYCLVPSLKLILGDELKKKKEVDNMLSRVKEIKEIIQEKK
jgi:predicted transcriptional regulator